jgi:hypothetical protein
MHAMQLFGKPPPNLEAEPETVARALTIVCAIDKCCGPAAIRGLCQRIIAPVSDYVGTIAKAMMPNATTANITALRRLCASITLFAGAAAPLILHYDGLNVTESLRAVKVGDPFHTDSMIDVAEMNDSGEKSLPAAPAAAADSKLTATKETRRVVGIACYGKLSFGEWVIKNGVWTTKTFPNPTFLQKYPQPKFEALASTPDATGTSIVPSMNDKRFKALGLPDNIDWNAFFGTDTPGRVLSMFTKWDLLRGMPFQDMYTLTVAFGKAVKELARIKLNDLLNVRASRCRFCTTLFVSGSSLTGTHEGYSSQRHRRARYNCDNVCLRR